MDVQSAMRPLIYPMSCGKPRLYPLGFAPRLTSEKVTKLTHIHPLGLVRSLLWVGLCSPEKYLSAPLNQFDSTGPNLNSDKQLQTIFALHVILADKQSEAAVFCDVHRSRRDGFLSSACRTPRRLFLHRFCLVKEIPPVEFLYFLCFFFPKKEERNRARYAFYNTAGPESLNTRSD